MKRIILFTILLLLPLTISPPTQPVEATEVEITSQLTLNLPQLPKWINITSEIYEGSGSTNYIRLVGSPLDFISVYGRFRSGTISTFDMYYQIGSDVKTDRLYIGDFIDINIRFYLNNTIKVYTNTSNFIYYDVVHFAAYSELIARGVSEYPLIVNISYQQSITQVTNTVTTTKTETITNTETDVVTNTETTTNTEVVTNTEVNTITNTEVETETQTEIETTWDTLGTDWYIITETETEIENTTRTQVINRYTTLTRTTDVQDFSDGFKWGRIANVVFYIGVIIGIVAILSKIMGKADKLQLSRSNKPIKKMGTEVLLCMVCKERLNLTDQYCLNCGTARKN